MELQEIKELIGVMRKNRIKEINLDREGSRVHIVACDPPERRREPAPVPAPPPQLAPMPYYSAAPPPAVLHAPEKAPAAPPAAPSAEKTAAPAPPPPEELVGVEIKSPMVGTFYRAPAPDAPPYVEVGAVITDDSVLCIIEAMKLMNEIKAEIRGKVIKVLVKNAQPVEYGQPLFLVEPF